jgi:hypothetical protein
MGAAGNENNEKQEAKRKTKHFRKWKGVFTQASRNAIPEENYYDLLNLIPIGAANVHTVPGPFISQSTFDTAAAYWGTYANINGTDYILFFTTNGNMWAYNMGADTYVKVATALSGSGSRATQWKNTAGLVIDSTGYYSYVGGGSGGWTKLSNTSNGLPTSGQDIAVAFGRVWIVQGRKLYYSAQDDYGANYTSLINAWANSTGYTSGQSVVDLASGNVYICTQTGTSAATGTGPTGTGTGIVDGSCLWSYVGTGAWTTSNGSSFINLTDPLLRSTVQRLWAQNGYLYIFGVSSVFVISNVYVPSGASPPLPVYTSLNVDPSVGTTNPASVFGFGRDVMYATPYGIYDLSGVEADRVSADIDGTWQFINKTTPISGGVCTVQNIQCAAFLINTVNDPITGSRNELALYFDKKWWFASYLDPTDSYSTVLSNPIAFVVPTIYNGVQTLYAVINLPSGANQVLRMFDNTNISPPVQAMTAWWDMDDPLSDKQSIRAGFEIAAGNIGGGSLNLFIDTPAGQVASGATAAKQTVTWYNNAGVVVTWKNSSGGVSIWYGGVYLLFNSTCPGSYQKYIGLTLTSTPSAYPNWAPVFELDGFYLDYHERARW